MSVICLGDLFRNLDFTRVLAILWFVIIVKKACTSTCKIVHVFDILKARKKSHKILAYLVAVAFKNPKNAMRILVICYTYCTVEIFILSISFFERG